MLLFRFLLGLALPCLVCFPGNTFPLKTLSPSLMMAQSPSALSFEAAIAQTRTLLAQVQQNQISEERFAEQVRELVQTANGARGFFVIYLTTEGDFADRPSRELLKALDSSPEIVSELLVKNLAMSSATGVLHRRNQDQEGALGSEKVLQRTLNLINQTDLAAIAAKLTALKMTITTGTGEYQTFIERWDYDQEQKQAILRAISKTRFAIARINLE